MKRSDYKVVGHLGFRKGSKGLLGKNEKIFFGKPLFQWSIDQLVGSEIINDFIENLDLIFEVIGKCENGTQNIDNLLVFDVCHSGFQRLN